MKVVSIVVREDAVVPFDRWLATELSLVLGRPTPRGLTRKAVVAGLVTVAGRIERNPDVMLRRGRSVFLRNLEWLPTTDVRSPLRVLHEDDAVIVIDKPAGLPTHETKDASRLSLTQLVENRLGKRVFVHHRLDAGTSGVVLFSKSAAANVKLAQSFAGRQVEKTYVALVSRPPNEWPSKFTVDSPILVADNGSVRVDSTGVAAVTEVRVIERRVDCQLVEAKPETGRKHQIRVHLASIGAPIVGDTRYGGRLTEAGRMMLHAERLELDHPVTGKRMRLRSPRPAEFTESHSAAGSGKGVSPEPETSPRAGRPLQPEVDRRSAKPPLRFRPDGGRTQVKSSRTGAGQRRPARAGARDSRR